MIWGPTDLAQVCDTQNKADSIENVRFSSPIKTGDCIEGWIETRDNLTLGVGFEPFQNNLCDVHLNTTQTAGTSVRRLFFSFLPCKKKKRRETKSGYVDNTRSSELRSNINFFAFIWSLMFALRIITEKEDCAIMSNVTLLRQSNDGGNRTPRLKRSHDAESGDGDTLVLQGISISQHSNDYILQNTNSISATPHRRQWRGRRTVPKRWGKLYQEKTFKYAKGLATFI